MYYLSKLPESLGNSQFFLSCFDTSVFLFSDFYFILSFPISYLLMYLMNVIQKRDYKRELMELIIIWLLNSGRIWHFIIYHNSESNKI